MSLRADGYSATVSKVRTFLLGLRNKSDVAKKTKIPINEWSSVGRPHDSSSLNFPLFVTTINESEQKQVTADDVLFVLVVTDSFTLGAEALILSLRKWVHPEPQIKIVCDENLDAFSRKRLEEISDGIEFIPPIVIDVDFDKFDNHERVGKFGYYSLTALSIFDHEYVVYLDSDVLVTGDISNLWRNAQDIVFAEDSGVKASTTWSAFTQRNVLNSGVIGLPKSIRNKNSLEKAKQIAANIATVNDPALNRFADQKFWNVFMRDQNIRILDPTLNLNKARLERHFDDLMPYVKIVHYTKIKPWKMLESGLDEEVRRHSRSFRRSFGVWTDNFNATRLKSRYDLFEQDELPTLLQTLENTKASNLVQIIGNGPSLPESLNRLDELSPKIAFNWFVRGELFDDVRPDHLVVSSHLLLGGWMTMKPEIPALWKDSLLSREHKPRLWFPFYFRSYIEQLSWLQDFAISYFFFEKPGRVNIEAIGNWDFDLTKPLVDCHTGVLTVGVPLAKRYRPQSIAFFGFDGSYISNSLPRYFYEQAIPHDANSTSETTLNHTWSSNGSGRFAAWIANKHLKECGIEAFHLSRDSHVTEIEDRSHSLDMRPQ